MNNTGLYAVLQTAPSRDRLEVITIGLAIYWRGAWDVRVLPDARKIRCLNPSFPLSGLVNISKTVTEILNGAVDFNEARQRLAILGNEPGLQQFVGQFPAENKTRYEAEIAWLMQDLVIPPVVKMKKIVEVGNSRLRTKLRKHFLKENMLSKDRDDIENHKVVEQFPIVENQGLYAQFALRNGVMHITETVDFDVEPGSYRNKMLEAQAKTLVLSAAVKNFGNETERYVITAGSNRTHAMQSINLLSDYGNVFAVESGEDMNMYFDKIRTAVATSSSVGFI